MSPLRQGLVMPVRRGDWRIQALIALFCAAVHLDLAIPGADPRHVAGLAVAGVWGAHSVRCWSPRWLPRRHA